MDGNQTERLSQTSECGNESKSGILEDASTFAQRVLEEIEALAGTAACKSFQLVRLKKWAICISLIPSSSAQGRVVTTPTTVFRLTPEDNLAK